MIQTGVPSMIGVTYAGGGGSLSVAARIFNSSGPVTGWLAMANFDGDSYNLAYTFGAVGAYSIKKVVFTDGTFTVRNNQFAEADDAVQVVNISGGGGGTTPIVGGVLTGVLENDTAINGILEGT